MMYPYMMLFDETEIVHSQIIEEDNIQKVIVHFERPTEDGFDYARCELPEYKWIQKKDILMKKSPYSSNYSKAMRICCISMRQREESRLPNLFTVSGYKIYFWANENGEPIHVHISKGKPSPNSTKYG